MIRASARRPADGARRAVGTPGRALDPAVRQRLGAAYGFDFASVRVHTDVAAARSAAELGAVAYTLGRDVVFGRNRYAPGTAAGDRLIAHELAHVVQQDGAPASLLSVGPATSDAERAAEDATAGRTPPRRAVAGGTIQRQVELRDVGRGEQSGIARLPELLSRLNSVSTGLTYALSGRTLTYVLRDGGIPSEFDRQMIGFIDSPAVLPLRLSNRQARTGNRVAGFTGQVVGDEFESGYADIDDLLSSDDAALQTVLTHILAERAATRDYARRIGTPGLAADFAAGHASGLAVETAVLRGYFGDLSIRALPEPVHGAGVVPGATITGHLFTNSRRDRIQLRVHLGARKDAGVDASSIRVVTRDGRTLSAEEYRELLRTEATAAQIRGERLRGATQETAGGRLVPGP